MFQRLRRFFHKDLEAGQHTMLRELLITKQLIFTLESQLATLLERTENLEKLSLVASDQFPKPSKNKIEEDVMKDIEITEDFRVPIVDGVKIRFETEQEARDIKIS